MQACPDPQQYVLLIPVQPEPVQLRVASPSRACWKAVLLTGARVSWRQPVRK